MNAGILWVAFGFLKGNILGSGSVSESAVLLPANTTIAPTPAPSTSQIYYTKAELGLGGSISLALTLANIVLIWIASMMMFRVKEVLPVKKKIFWSDLGVARKIYGKRALITESLVARSTVRESQLLAQAAADLLKDLRTDGDASEKDQTAPAAVKKY